MPSRLEIVDLMGEKEEDDRLGASKFVAKKPYQGLLVYSLSSRDPRLFEDIKATVRDQMYSVGASLEQNDQDRTGDGDQSPIIDSNAQQVYEELFRSGE